MATTRTVTQLDNDSSYMVQDKQMYDFWDKINLVDQINGKNIMGQQMIFLEGPPFISGPSLHIGHCLISEIKSCIIKYFQMRGNLCYPYTGTDNHGLPIENFVCKQLGLQTPQDVVKYGIDNFNRVCKETVLKCETLWDPVYKSIGRPVDVTHRYRTMDINFMESVFWVFKTLWNKGLIYKGWKVLPYSYKTGTVLSNFEASQCYVDIKDITTYVYFPLVNEQNCGIVAWTTTPWTLPANLALCVHPEGKYVKITDMNDRSYIMHEKYTKNLNFRIKSTEFYKLGKEMVGLEYLPPFTYFSKFDRKYKIVSDTFVDINGGIGSGIVHLAPTHGEIDYDVCVSKNIVTMEDIISLCTVDDNGNFNKLVGDYVGINVFESNPMIIKYLQQKNLLVKTEKYTHSYPHSDRTGEPLIYRTMPSYFVKVTSIKDNLIEMNKKIQWFPKHVGCGRFQNWLENVKDWSISRSRFFGTPIPVWVSDDGMESICIGSINELVELAKLKETPTDLHPEFLDKITIVSPKTGKLLHREPLVLDCWFESGSVPYGQIHYPFENTHIFDNSEYLSDFVCEGIDQTRGWFYTLLVLSTALFNKPPFKNVICPGLILGKDGKKISKRNGNYKDPKEIIEKYGSDALRLYLLGSSAVKANNFMFDEDDILIVKQKLIQFINGIKFFIEHYSSYTKLGNQLDMQMYIQSTNMLDKWIVTCTQNLIRDINSRMNNFDIEQCPQIIYKFIENFTNFYIKLNRNRLRGIDTAHEWELSLSTTYYVIINITKCFVPFMPFLADYIYQHIKQIDEQQYTSVHLCQSPSVSEKQSASDMILMNAIDIIQNVLTKSRAVRSKTTIFASIRKPIQKLYVCHNNEEILEIIKCFKNILCTEVNCLDVSFGLTKNFICYKAKINMKELAIKYRNHMKNIARILEILHSNQKLLEIFYISNDAISINLNDDTLILTHKELEVLPEVGPMFGNNIMTTMENGLIVGIDTNTSDELLQKYIIRQFCIAVQKMRKSVDIHPWDKICVLFDSSEGVTQTLLKHMDQCHEKLKCDIQNCKQLNDIKYIHLISSNIKLLTLDDKKYGIINVSIYKYVQ